MKIEYWAKRGATGCRSDEDAAMASARIKVDESFEDVRSALITYIIREATWIQDTHGDEEWKKKRVTNLLRAAMDTAKAKEEHFKGGTWSNIRFRVEDPGLYFEIVRIEK